MRRHAAFLLFALAPLASAQTSYFAANLVSENEVPPNPSTARGFAVVKLVEPANTVSIYTTSFGLSASATAAHIHRAPAGVNGPVVIGFTGGPNVWTGSGTMTAADVALLKTGGFYCNVHTTANPGGEIRGQVLAGTQTQLLALMDGTQEVPPTPSATRGIGNVRLFEPDNVVHVEMNAGAFTTAVVAAHIHQAPAGVNGGVIVPLAGGPATWCNVGQLTAAQVTAIKTSGCYLNIHTSAFPGGEIRGQILGRDPGTFGGVMNAAQETPPNGSPGIGWGCARLNPDNTVTYNVSFAGLTGAPTAAHVHQAAPGIAGPVIFPITATGPGTYGGTSPALTGAQLTALQAGNIYFNIHTAVNPGGEIRGQMNAQRLATTFGHPGTGSGGARAWMKSDAGPCIGAAWNIAFTGANPGLASLTYLSFSRDTIGGFVPLPLDLGAAIGATGSFLLVDITMVAPIVNVTDPSGCISFNLPVPFSPPLVGAPVYAQSLLLDLGAPGGLVMSNALTATIQ